MLLLDAPIRLPVELACTGVNPAIVERGTLLRFSPQRCVIEFEKPAAELPQDAGVVVVLNDRSDLKILGTVQSHTAQRCEILVRRLVNREKRYYPRAFGG